MSRAAPPVARTRRKTPHVGAPVARDRTVPIPDEDVEDPATVLSHSSHSRQLRHFNPELAEEDAEDAHTVRVSRMPVAFIGESVTDPTTAMDTSEAAARWREQAGIDEIDPLLDAHSLDPDPPKRTPEPPVHVVEAPRPPVAAEEPALSTIVTSLLLGAVIGVGAVGLTAYFLF